VLLDVLFKVLHNVYKVHYLHLYTHIQNHPYNKGVLLFMSELRERIRKGTGRTIFKVAK